MKKILLVLLILGSIFGSFMHTAYSADTFDTSSLGEVLLNQDPDPVEPGDYVELRFKVEKMGNSVLNDIKYELVLDYPFSFDNSDTPIKSLGDWMGNSEDDEFYLLYYKIKVDEDALKGTYDVKLKQSSSSTTIVRENEYSIRVDEKKSPNLIIGKVETSPSKLISDFDEASLKVELVNIGDETAQQVIVDLNLPQGFKESFGYSTRTNIGSVEDGQSKYATFYIDTNEGILKGNHNATITVTYKDESEDNSKKFKTKTIPFDITVFGRPEYKLEVVNVSNVKPGESSEVFVKIKNIGSRESDSTSIQIFKDSSQPFEFEDKSDFIGKIGVNEYGESVFKFDVKNDAVPKEYKLKLQIRSVVDNDVLVEDETIVVNVVNGKDNSPVFDAIIKFVVYAVFLIIGILLGKRIANRQKKKKNQ